MPLYNCRAVAQPQRQPPCAEAPGLVPKPASRGASAGVSAAHATACVQKWTAGVKG